MRKTSSVFFGDQSGIPHLRLSTASQADSDLQKARFNDQEKNIINEVASMLRQELTQKIKGLNASPQDLDKQINDRLNALRLSRGVQDPLDANGDEPVAAEI